MQSNDAGKLIEFSLGTLDSDNEQKPDAHIYMKNCVKWNNVNDYIPQYLEGRDSPFAT